MTSQSKSSHSTVESRPVSCTAVAVFDFDNTITWRDSLAPFLIYLVGFLKTYYNLFLLMPCFIGFLFKMIPRQTTKETILSRFCQGMSIHVLRQKGKEYADHLLDELINPQAIRRLRWHQKQGHCCILVSASIDIYLIPWAKRYGFNHVLASNLEVTQDGSITGKLAGPNCWGPEKRKRLIKLLGPEKNYELYVYGDSRGDQELLEIADYPYYQKYS